MTPTGSVPRVTGAKRSCGWSAACWARGVCAEAEETAEEIAGAGRAKRRIWPPRAAAVLAGGAVKRHEAQLRLVGRLLGQRGLRRGGRDGGGNRESGKDEAAHLASKSSARVAGRGGESARSGVPIRHAPRRSERNVTRGLPAVAFGKSA